MKHISEEFKKLIIQWIIGDIWAGDWEQAEYWFKYLKNKDENWNSIEF